VLASDVDAQETVVQDRQADEDTGWSTNDTVTTSGECEHNDSHSFPMSHHYVNYSDCPPTICIDVICTATGLIIDRLYLQKIVPG